MDIILKSTRTVRGLASRMAKPKSTASERNACWEVIQRELDILDAQAALIAESLRLLGKQPADSRSIHSTTTSNGQ